MADIIKMLEEEEIARLGKKTVSYTHLKTPGSGEMENNLWENLHHLKTTDEVKFVLCNRADYEWAKGILAQKNIADQCPVLFSPVYSQVKPTDLAEWVLADQLPVRMQLQLHKILWGEVAGK